MADADKELHIAFQEKERLESFLANLDALYADKTVNNSTYNTLKGEYSVNLKKITSQIQRLKMEIDKRLQARAHELAVYRQELANLAARHKVGQISTDAYFRSSRIPEKKIASAEGMVAQLTSLLQASHSSEIVFKPEGSLASLFSFKGRNPKQPAHHASVPYVPVDLPAAQPQAQPAPPAAAPDTAVISSLVILPECVQPGHTVGVIATIVNAGTAAVTHRAEFKVNYKLESVNDITLEPGQSSELTFMTVAGPPGDHTVSVDAATAVLRVIPFS